MRRQRSNYWLSTEPEANLKELSSCPLTGIFTGLRSSALTEDKLPLDVDTIASENHGGPLFLYSADINKTWVLMSDEILRSIVIRQVECSPTASTFSDELYAGVNDVPEFLKVKAVVDLSKAFSIEFPQKLLALKVFKLPDNYDLSTPSVHSPSQCAIEFVFESTEVLAGYQMDSSLQGHRFLHWDEVRSDFPREKMTICLDFSTTESRGQAN